MIRRLALAAVLVATTGCPPRGDAHPPDDETGTDEPTPAEPPGVCGTSATRFTDHGFVPVDATLVATIDLAAPDLAAALLALREHLRSADRAIPVRAAFALEQWHWQVPLLRDLLLRQGLAPAELVALQLDRGLVGWVLPLGCSPDDAIAIVRAHGVAIDDAGTIAIAPADPERTAWDLVIGPGPIASLAPAGRGRELAARLERGASATAQATSPRERLATIAAAPVRVVLVDRGFVTGEAAIPGGARSIRAHGHGVEDATLPDP